MSETIDFSAFLENPEEEENGLKAKCPGLFCQNIFQDLKNIFGLMLMHG